MGSGPPTSGLTKPHHYTQATCPLRCVVGHLSPRKDHQLADLQLPSQHLISMMDHDFSTSPARGQRGLPGRSHWGQSTATVITGSEDIQLGHRSCGEEAQKDATPFSGSSNIISHEKVLFENKLLSNTLYKQLCPSRNKRWQERSQTTVITVTIDSSVFWEKAFHFNKSIEKMGVLPAFWGAVE